MTRYALRRLVWESLPRDQRLAEAGARYVRTTVGARFEELEGLTEPELLALLPESAREDVTAQLNGETAPKRAARVGPGPRKARPKEAKKKRVAGDD